RVLPRSTETSVSGPARNARRSPPVSSRARRSGTAERWAGVDGTLLSSRGRGGSTADSPSARRLDSPSRRPRPRATAHAAWARARGAGAQSPQKRRGARGLAGGRGDGRPLGARGLAAGGELRARGPPKPTKVTPQDQGDDLGHRGARFPVER